MSWKEEEVSGLPGSMIDGRIKKNIYIWIETQNSAFTKNLFSQFFSFFFYFVYFLPTSLYMNGSVGSSLGLADDVWDQLQIWKGRSMRNLSETKKKKLGEKNISAWELCEIPWIPKHQLISFNEELIWFDIKVKVYTAKINNITCNMSKMECPRKRGYWFFYLMNFRMFTNFKD